MPSAEADLSPGGCAVTASMPVTLRSRTPQREREALRRLLGSPLHRSGLLHQLRQCGDHSARLAGGGANQLGVDAHEGLMPEPREEHHKAKITHGLAVEHPAE